MDHLSPSLPDLVLPSPSELSAARNAIHTSLPGTPLGLDATREHLQFLEQGMDRPAASPRYYGFVTGGALPASVAADHLVTKWDQNVHSHLPGERVASDVEHAALGMLKELVGLGPEWEHGIFTTGATGANVVGLAAAREAVIARAGGGSVAEKGMLPALTAAGKKGVQILSAAPHSSLRKACAVLGLGHESIVDVAVEGKEWQIDMAKLEERLKDDGVVNIVSVSCSEVQTGLFATGGLEDMRAIRKLADQHGAWLHVDAAFGLMARILPEGKEFAALRRGVEGMELADSIAGDAHKLFNVPYDCGFLLSKHLDTAFQVFQNPGAPYLSVEPDAIPSALNIGLENSRRFRALPVYANLVAYGRQGYQEMLVRQIRVARGAAAFIKEQKGYELLPEGIALEDVYIIVLFRAKDAKINATLRDRINVQRRIYCSGSMYDGKPAIRLAVSHWMADADRDLSVVQDVLSKALRD